MANFNRNYTAVVGVKFSDTQLNAQLKNLSNKTISLDTSKAKSGVGTLDDSIVKVTKTAQKFGKEADVSMNKATKQIKNASRASMTLGAKFVDITKKVLAFGAVTSMISAFTGVMYKAVDVTKEYNKAQVEFNKVTELGSEQVKQYTENLGEMGDEVGRTRTELLESATAFKKAGYTSEDSAELAKITALYQNTADEILSTSDASSTLISQLKAFNIEAEDSISVIDSINAVSADFAVSSADIGRGLTASSASLSTYGNTFSEVIGLLTAGTTIFQGQSTKVATGLNMIASRISKNEDALAEYGIAIKDSEGNLRSTYDVLYDLSFQWENMSNAEQVALGQTLAG